MPDDDFKMTQLDAKERRLFQSLPREMQIVREDEDRLVHTLRSEGFFERHRLAPRPAARLVAAVALMLGGAVIGSVIGARAATRTSLEAQLARNDLTSAERILLLQRAGSAYVQAAHAYADATAQTDSTAVEVARQVLLGAAHAVVRTRLDGGMAASLTSVLQDSTIRRVARPQPSPLIWY
jgi:hypothetical protein